MSTELPRIRTVEELGAKRHATRLSNGVKAVLFETHGLPVFMHTIAQSGSRFDEVGKEGSAHFLEHMLVAGTERLPSKSAISSYIRAEGGGIGASTGVEDMYIKTWVPSADDAELAFDLIHQVLTESVFSPVTIELERNSIQEERRGGVANPSENIVYIARQVVFQGTELGRPIIGTEQSIQDLTAGDLKSFQRASITSDRTAIVGSGGISFERFVDLAETYIDVPQLETYKPSLDIAVSREIPLHIEPYRDADQAEVALGFRTPGILEADATAISFLANILNGETETSLFKQLRVDRGLVYDVSTNSRAYTDAGAFYIYTSTGTDNVQPVLDVITDTLKRIADSGVSEEALAYHKRLSIKSMPYINVERSWVEGNSANELTYSEGMTLPDLVTKQSAVTSEQIREVAAKYLRSDAWYLAICGNPHMKEPKVNL